MGSGSILNEVIQAQEILEDQYKIPSEIWSCTSFSELRRDGLDCQRWNLLNPGKKLRRSYVSECLGTSDSPVIAASDYMKIFADQIRPFIKSDYFVLGTDGYGRSDTREKLRGFFEVDRYFIAYTAIKALYDQKKISLDILNSALKTFKINPNKLNPRNN